jgi:hypothetical protein
MARTGLRMMPTFPLSSLKFRTAGFPQYGFKAGISGGAFPSTARSARRAVCIRPSCSSLNLVFSRSESGDGLSLNTSVRAAIAALPQGPSLRSGLYCPGPSSLNWSHAPHSQAHLDFTETAYTRCLRCAAYCDLGNPRVDPCFRWHSVSTCRPPRPREVHSAAYTQFLHRRRWPSTKGDCGLGTSKFPTLRFSWGDPFSRLHYGSLSLQPVDLLAHQSELTRSSPSQRGLLLPGFRRIGLPLRRRI